MTPLHQNPRNKPCPCNSGAKFKKCCGSPEALRKAREEEARRHEEARKIRLLEWEERRQKWLKDNPGKEHIPFRLSAQFGIFLATALALSPSRITRFP